MSIMLKHYPSKNFGDYVSKVITYYMSEKVVQPVDKDYKHKHYIVTGSILSWVNFESIVWGAGSAWYGEEYNKAMKYYAVRGKLSQEKVWKLGQTCEAYGDPILLLPLFIKPNKDRNKKLGIVPHVVDYTMVSELYKDDKNVIVISLYDDYKNVISQITSCKKIISSSLHGLVVADAYGIPNRWVEFSDKVVGDGFKFHDYFSGMNIPLYKPINIKEEKMEVDEICKRIVKYDIDFNKVSKRLFDCCPFKSENVKYKILI